jgi:hypothetical protein
MLKGRLCNTSYKVNLLIYTLRAILLVSAILRGLLNVLGLRLKTTYIININERRFH